MAAIHVGVSASSSDAGRRRQLRRACSTRNAPRPSLIQYDVSEAVLSVATSPASAIAYTTPLTTARPSTQPTRKERPFTRARGENSIRITAMIETGLTAIPTANGMTSPMACPMALPNL
jgi:hypothetical protein